jgi:glutamate-1-semialdehyde 2,1-aminomutase
VIGSQNRGTARSWALRERGLAVTPMATQTHSKAARPQLKEQEPCYIERGEGCRVWDVDGNEYIDLRNGLGPITLGYRFAAVEDAVRRQLDSGTVFSYSHPLEVEVAEELVRRIPCAESVRFLKTGGEAMAAALRLARAYTGRDTILTCGYHGWVNNVSRPGAPQAWRQVSIEMPWGEVGAYEDFLAAHPDQVACISVACSYADMAVGQDFLPALRRLCDRYGALLVFDEIVTGFRLRLGGAQEYFGVMPDLAVFAKGMSNGVPCACYLGRRQVMDKVAEASISSTYGGDALGLAAARAVLRVYQEEPVIETLWQRGRQLHQGFAALCARRGIDAAFAGLPPTGLLAFGAADAAGAAALFQRFNGEALRHGVIIYNVCYPNYSHTEADIDTVLAVMDQALAAMQEDGCFA